MKFEIRNKQDEFVGLPWSGQDRFELVCMIEGQSVWRHLSFWKRRYLAEKEKAWLEHLQEMHLGELDPASKDWKGRLKDRKRWVDEVKERADNSASPREDYLV